MTSVLPSLSRSFAQVCPCFPSRSPVSSAVLPPAIQVDAAKVAGWLRRYEDAFPRIERMAAQGDCYFMHREMQKITPLLAEGQGIASSTTSPFLSGMIDTLAKPRLARLQQSLPAWQRQIADHPDLMEAGKVTDWLRSFDAAFSRIERIAAQGASSLLQKEIKEMTALVTQAQEFTSSTTPLHLARMVVSLVKPRLVRTEQALPTWKKQIADHPDLLEKDEKLVAKWDKLGLPQSVLENHIDCARFLVDSSLVFKIVGYRQTCGDPQLHDVQLDPDGMPKIKVEGVFKRWDLLKREIAYDEKTDQIRSIAYSGQVAQCWSYLANGLVKIDRLNHATMVPVHRLNPAERQRVVDHARKFYETNTEVDQGIPKDWVVQFHTSPRRQFVASVPPLPDNPLLDNLAKNLNTHIVMRLIAPNGDVYSFGMEMPADSQEFLWENNMAKMLGTVTARINKAGDYEEFRTHVGRYVTGIPLTGQRAQNIINFVNTSGDIRFNFLWQNCSNLMSVVMKFTGYDVPTQTDVKGFFYDILPDVKHLPLIGPCLDKINHVGKKIFSCIVWATPKLLRTVASAVGDTLLYLPRKVHTFAINLLIRRLGGTTMLHALPEGTEDEPFYPAGRFLNFSRIMRSWKDLFSEEPMQVYHSKYFVDWQKQQHSTFLEPGSALPKLAVVPPAV